MNLNSVRITKRILVSLCLTVLMQMIVIIVENYPIFSSDKVFNTVSQHFILKSFVFKPFPA